MEEIKAPKKERKFLKAMGDVALTLFRELLLGVGKKVINKVGNKRQGLAIAFVMAAGISYASIDSIPYPITGNKQKLGWQTTGNGLVYRGSAADTVTKPTSYADKNVKAYLILDSVSGSLYVFKQGAWAAISGGGGGLTMPFDSITLNTAKDGTVGVGEVEYNDTQGSLIQGLKGGLVTNVIGQQLHQRVNNRTGATLNKGDVVYLSGSQGNRITVAKAIATSDPTSANTFGIVAESIADNQSGYVITEGLITNINTSALTQDSAVYLSGITAGTLTSTKPQSPIHGVYIGVCVKSNAGSGELFVKIRNGQELDELHDVQITSPINNASLYYKSSEGLWRDTTSALLVSDTAAMLSNYLLSGTASSTYTPLTRSISTTLPLQGGGNLFSNRTFSILSASESQSGILTTTAQNIGGSKAFKANIVADSFIYLNNTSPVPTTLLGLNTSGNVNNVGRFSLGAGLSINSGILLTDTNFLVTRFDTASMLTNYLRSGVAASTYLPLTGGTLTGGLTGTTGTFTGLNINNGGYSGSESGSFKIKGTLSPSKILEIGFNETDNYGIINVLQGGVSAFPLVLNNSGGRVGINNTNPLINLAIKGKRNEKYNNSTFWNYSFVGQEIFNESDTINSIAGITFINGSNRNSVSAIGGFSESNTLGGLSFFTGGSGRSSQVIEAQRINSYGEATFFYPFTSNSSAVFNESSLDADFRVESDGNANMVFVDASTNRVGIGTNSPSKTLDVNGELKIATTTATPTSLLGKDGSNVVGEVTTIAQTGLMTRGETTVTTGSPSATFTVNHGLGSNPTAVLITSAGIGGGDKIIFEVYAKNSTTFSVQAWNYDGTEASSKDVKIYWLAIK